MDPLSFDVKGTALDVLPETEHLVIGGDHTITVLTVSSSSATTLLRQRSNRSLVRLLKFNPIWTGCLALASGQFLDVHLLANSQIVKYASFRAQSRKITDFCWCPFDEKLLATSADQDSVNLWDLRTDVRKPSAQLGLIFGATQAKFAPHLNNYLMTSHGTDCRLWDLRHTSHAISQFNAHKSKVLCLDWHPHQHELSNFFTSSCDNKLKLWTLTEQKVVPSVVNIAHFSAWRLVFSQEGEELAALPLPPGENVALYSDYGLEKQRHLKSRNGDSEWPMDAAWHKSTTAQKSTTKFLYTLSQKQKLCRHPIAYELSNEMRDEMSTPITQSKADEERDRLVAAVEQQQAEADLLALGIDGSSLDDMLTGDSIKAETAAEADRNRFSISSRSTLIGSVRGMVTTATTDGGTTSVTGVGGGATPQSPIYSEWQRWIRAPNMTGGDLMTELEALRNNITEGLSTTEVNFQRAAIGFTYIHVNKCRKLKFEMRFHREFIENGLVFVEVLQKDSPFSPDKASLFLTMLQHESDEQQRVPSLETILCRVLRQLPRLISLMKVFTPTIDVPCPSKASSQSGSAGEDQHLAWLGLTAEATGTAGQAGADLMAESKAKTATPATVLLPVSYTPSTFDHRVPAPRNSGARFNKSGYLVTFGRIGPVFAGKWAGNNRSGGGGGKTARMDVRAGKDAGRNISRVVPFAKVGRRVGGGALRPGLAQTQGKAHPRSLAEYCILVNPPALAGRQVSAAVGASAIFSLGSGGLSQCSPPSVPFRCSSPSRPPSPWPLVSDSPIPIPLDGAEQRQQLKQKQSLSPPSLLLTGHMETEAEVTHSLDECTTKTTQTQHRSTGTPTPAKPIAVARIFGSSPKSASSVVQSFSLQNQPVSSTYRHRGGSLSAGGTAGAQVTGIGPATECFPSPGGALATAYAQQTLLAEHGGQEPSAVMPEQSFCSTVSVYDTATLLPISYSLARSYKLLGNTALEICQHNMDQVVKKGRKDLVAVWKLLEHCAKAQETGNIRKKSQLENGKDEMFARLYRLKKEDLSRALNTCSILEMPWTAHPLGRELINRILVHYINRNDLQTAAAITCMFSMLDWTRKTAGMDGQKTDIISDPEDLSCSTIATSRANPLVHSSQSPATPDPLNLLLTADVVVGSKLSSASGRKASTAAALLGPGPLISSFANPLFRGSLNTTTTAAVEINTFSRENSSADRLSPAPEFFCSPSPPSNGMTVRPEAIQSLLTQKERQQKEPMLDPAMSVRFDEIRRRYADILHRWRMYKKSAEVMKHCSVDKKNSNGMNPVGVIPVLCWCSNCAQRQEDSKKCENCRRPPICCAICEKPCRGVVVTCVSCSHGGHYLHVAEWFEAQSHCPFGCGCECKF